MTIVDKTDGIEITTSGGDVIYIKNENIKIVKRDVITIYDVSERNRGLGSIIVDYDDVTSPITSDLNDLYNTIINYID